MDNSERQVSIKVPVCFIARTSEYCQVNGILVKKYAVQVLKEFEPSVSTETYFKAELMARHGLNEAEYSAFCAVGNLGRKVHIDDQVYTYVKKVWYVCH